MYNTFTKLISQKNIRIIWSYFKKILLLYARMFLLKIKTILFYFNKSFS